jgi:hypothetical protein
MFRTLSIFLLPLALGALPAPRACDEDEKVKVTLLLILASEQGDKVDPKLKEFATRVQEINPSLKSFRIKAETSKSLDEGEKATFTLVEGKSAQVVVQKAADKKNRVVLAVTAPDQGEIVYRAVCGKFVPIVTRCLTRPSDPKLPRERLILAIRVQPCPGD